MRIHVGILALQGNFAQHYTVLESLHDPRIIIHYISSKKDIEAYTDENTSSYHAIILPGGESSTMIHLLHTSEIFSPLQKIIQKDTPVLATCAGALLLAPHSLLSDPTDDKKHASSSSSALAHSHMHLIRNAYGRQIHSITATLDFTPSLKHIQDNSVSPPSSIKGMFIRAPKISSFDPNKVEVLSQYKGDPVIVLERNMLISTFHPEALYEPALHNYFISHIVVPYAHTHAPSS